MNLIYCVEDDEHIRNLIVYALENNDFSVKGFETANPFYQEMSVKIPDLIILDIMLPGEDGLTILDNLRSDSKTLDIPVIMLTAKTSEFDKVKGLNLGADDYISKPFGVMELIARVNAVLRRTNKSNPKFIYVNNIKINPNNRNVYINDNIIELTFKEYELLYLLAINKNIVLSRDKLLLDIWGFDFTGETRTVDVHIGNLRQKLGSEGLNIKTIRNVGYILEE